MKAKTLGFIGEELTAHYLQSKGYKIIQNNFVVKGGEIDIIARQNGLLVFIEVKTRTSDSFGRGEESFNYFKKKRLLTAIYRYLEKNNCENSDYRIDLIEIELNPDTNSLKNISHFEDVEL